MNLIFAFIYSKIFGNLSFIRTFVLISLIIFKTYFVLVKVV